MKTSNISIIFGILMSLGLSMASADTLGVDAGDVENPIKPIDNGDFLRHVFEKSVGAEMRHADTHDVVDAYVYQLGYQAVADGIVDRPEDFVSLKPEKDMLEPFLSGIGSQSLSIASAPKVIITIYPKKQVISGLDPTQVAKVFVQSDVLGQGKNSAANEGYFSSGKFIISWSPYKIKDVTYLIQKPGGGLQLLDTCAATIKSGSPDIVVSRNNQTCKVTWKYKGFGQTSRKLSFQLVNGGLDGRLNVDFGTNVASGFGPKSFPLKASIERMEWFGEHAGWDKFAHAFETTILVSTKNGGAVAKLPTPSNDIGIPSLTTLGSNLLYLVPSKWTAGKNVTVVNQKRIMVGQYHPATVSYTGQVGNQKLVVKFGSRYLGPGIDPNKVDVAYVVGNRLGWSYVFSAPLKKDAYGNYMFTFWNKLPNYEWPANDLLDNDSVNVVIHTMDGNHYFLSPESFKIGTGVKVLGSQFSYGPLITSTIKYDATANTITLRWNVDAFVYFSESIKESDVTEALLFDVNNYWATIAHGNITKDTAGHFIATFNLGNIKNKCVTAGVETSNGPLSMTAPNLFTTVDPSTGIVVKNMTVGPNGDSACFGN